MPARDRTSALLAARYGGPRRARRLVVTVVVGAIVVAGLVWLAWAAWFHSNPDVRAQVTSYDVVSSHEARAKVDLSVAGDHVRGTCLLRATAADHSIVGERNVTIADLQASRGEWLSVRTERRATSVTLEGCATTR